MKLAAAILAAAAAFLLGLWMAYDRWGRGWIDEQIVLPSPPNADGWQEGDVVDVAPNLL